MAKLYTALERAISPSLEFLSLTELLNQGLPVEDIFAGAQLDRGFIDDQQLQKFQRQSELHTSDLIHIMLEMDGVETVRSLTIFSDRSTTPQSWALALDPQLTPSLKSLNQAIKDGDLKFYKGQINCSLDSDKVKAVKSTFFPNDDKSLDLKIQQDIPLPTGDYRELADYETIQNEFPLTYGIGDIGLPASAKAARKAQAKQLQAYLMVFDQLLANYFAQLDRVRELFSLSSRELKTYFAQSIDHFPGAQEILKESYSSYLEGSSPSETEELDRKNRFLDHLIAQYGETFTDYSLLYPDSELSAAIANHKIDFALDYRQISAGRNQAFNYTLNPNKIENFNNVSGLKRRIARLLAGLRQKHRFKKG